MPMLTRTFHAHDNQVDLTPRYVPVRQVVHEEDIHEYRVRLGDERIGLNVRLGLFSGRHVGALHYGDTCPRPCIGMHPDFRFLVVMTCACMLGVSPECKGEVTTFQKVLSKQWPPIDACNYNNSVP